MREPTEHHRRLRGHQIHWLSHVSRQAEEMSSRRPRFPRKRRFSMAPAIEASLSLQQSTNERTRETGILQRQIVRSTDSSVAWQSFLQDWRELSNIEWASHFSTARHVPEYADSWRLPTVLFSEQRLSNSPDSDTVSTKSRALSAHSPESK